MRICLEFTPDMTPVHRARLNYAFRLFCAIYGHEPLLELEQGGSADAWVRYDANTGDTTVRSVVLSNLYRPRSHYEPAPPPAEFARDGEKTALFYAPLPGQEPDWLAEIFEWVSCADEYGVKERDSLGRIPFEATYAGRHSIDVRRPYAAIAMRFLQRALSRVLTQVPAEPQSPTGARRHSIVATHDIDYLPVNRRNGVVRLAKNAAISALWYKMPRLGVQQARMALRMASGGCDPMDQIPALVEEEIRRGVTSSFYFIPRHLHRRDANYTIHLPGLADLMRSLQAQGMEVGVHGSYTCLDNLDGFADECSLLREQGFRPQGGRQHWLRFTLDRLIPALERAGVLYDTSFGWSDRIGFRAGACFPFPPYNFDQERPATLLEIPLAVMDQGLQEESAEEAEWYGEAADLLAASRKYGWGGISLLWHPAAFGGGWLSPDVGMTYWRLQEGREEWNDTWLSAASFVHAVRQRFVDVGLLPAGYGLAFAEKQAQPRQSELAEARSVRVDSMLDGVTLGAEIT